MPGCKCARNSIHIKSQLSISLQFLLYHAAENRVNLEDLPDGSKITALNGEEIAVSDDPRSLNDAQVIDGLIAKVEYERLFYAIDLILRPTSFTSSVLDMCHDNDDLSTLVKAATKAKAGLNGILDGDGPITLFGTYIVLNSLFIDMSLIFPLILILLNVLLMYCSTSIIQLHPIVQLQSIPRMERLTQKSSSIMELNGTSTLNYSQVTMKI